MSKPVARAETIHTVLVPGLACTAQVFEAVLPYVRAHGAVTVADTRRDGTIAGMAERLLADAPERFALVGFSMGGFVASAVMELAPERVCGLGFISSASRPDTPEQAAGRRELIALARGGRFDEVTGAVFLRLAGPTLAPLWAQMAEEVGVEVFCAQVEAILSRSDYRSALGAAACPAAVIHGGSDQMVSLERAEALAAGVPHVTSTIVEGAGHLVLLERPQEVGAALGALLEQAKAR